MEFNPQARCPILTTGANKCPFGCTNSRVLCHYYIQGRCLYQKLHKGYCNLGLHTCDAPGSYDHQRDGSTDKEWQTKDKKRSRSTTHQEPPTRNVPLTPPPGTTNVEPKHTEAEAPIAKRTRRGTEQDEKNWRAEKQRKDDIVDLQVQLTRLEIYTHEVPNAARVEKAYERALWKLGPYQTSDAEHIRRLQDAFKYIMKDIGKKRAHEYIEYWVSKRRESPEGNASVGNR